MKSSRIRYLDIGNNYFSNLNPRTKKNIINLLDAYINNLTNDGIEDFETALKIYFSE